MHPSPRLIVNADDFGRSRGINRGILECHERGVLTSASLMVLEPAAEEAVAISREHPSLSVGLHWDVVGNDEHDFDFDDAQLVRDAFLAQLERFREQMGREPTHVDSHRHTHQRPWVREQLEELVRPLGIPLRFDGQVHFIGDFYAQPQRGVSEPERVSVGELERILRQELRDGWTEIGCHPGYQGPDLRSSYSSEREVEVRTLTDPRVRDAVRELGIVLASYLTFAQAACTSA